MATMAKALRNQTHGILPASKPRSVRCTTGSSTGVKASAPKVDPSVVFSPDEREVQATAGVPDQVVAHVAPFIRPAMPQQHRLFFQEREVVYVALQDTAAGTPLTGIVTGPKGFISTPDDRSLQLDLSAACVCGPPRSSFQEGALFGMLGLQHETRRRNRVNGRVVGVHGAVVTVAVDQSFGNCPKYIQKREVAFQEEWVDRAREEAAATRAGETVVDGEARRLIEAADTFFISSASRPDVEGPARGIDVSHRGGPAGFVRVAPDGGRLRFADYRGNDFFMTLGNIAATRAVSLLFVDYENGAVVLVSGGAEIDWEDQSLPGAQRTIVVTISSCKFLGPRSVAVRGGPVIEWSPHNPE